MNAAPDEKKKENQAEPVKALSDSELEQVSGGTGRWEERDLIREFPEIEYGEP